MRVVILGCGYVGVELGKQLSAHDVVGVRRSRDGLDAIEDAGLTAIQADITDPSSLASVPDADVLVFAASSGGRDAEAARNIYVEGQRTAIEQFCTREHPPDRYVYTSSTGVYGDHDGGWVDEETPLDPTTAKAEMLVEAEECALELPAEYGIDGTVVRYAGLYGPGRYRLERYLDGPVTEGYVNLLHREDAAGIVAFLLERNLARGETVLGVDNEPVSRWTLADWLASECGQPDPPKRTVEQRLEDDDLSERARRRVLADKRCSNAYLRELGYTFEYPTFREGYRFAIESYRDGER